MKKVLFVLENAGLGGTATSLLNLLSLWNSQEYVADLFLMQHSGPFLDRAKTLNLLPEERIISSILCPKSMLKQKGVLSILVRLAFTISHRLFGVQKTTKWFYRRSAHKLSNKYDVVVAYQESLPTEYVRYIKAPSRVAWCHTDFHAFSKGKTIGEMRTLYDCFNAVACVSENLRRSMIEQLDVNPERIHTIRNTIPSQFIQTKANDLADPIEVGAFTFVSCGRFAPCKRFDRIVLAALALRNLSIDFRWYLLGQGEEYIKIQQAVQRNDLQSHLILTGSKSNPFPYIAKADCFVMTSEREGQPMVLNEALTLGVPVITTEFPSAREVVQHGVNALISPNDDNDFIQTVLQFVNNPNLQKTLKAGAATFRYDNDSILEQISDLFTFTLQEAISRDKVSSHHSI